MELSYTCWKTDDGWYIGYLNQYPEHWTQGKSVKELEEMLVSLYNDVMLTEDTKPTGPLLTGMVAVPA